MTKKLFGLILIIFLTAAPTFRAVAFFPNDPYYHNQWYLDKVLAYDAWDKVNTSPNIVVAVIDSGVQINHPDLEANIWTNPKEISNNHKDDDHNGYIDDAHGWDFVKNVPDPAPKFTDDFTYTGLSHGTLMAGIIGAVGNNGKGVAGVTWKVKIMPLRALNENGEGSFKDVIRAIDYAINNGADIINLSFTGTHYNESLKEALGRAYQAGVLVVAAAGNDQGNNSGGYNTNKTPLYPACYEGDKGENLVIGVAATDALDQKAPFSSYGTNCVDISAPGVSYFNTVFEKPGLANGQFDKYYDGYWSGTSMATALVSGSLALIKQANPLLNHDQVIQTLLRSTDNIDKINPKYAGQLGTGRLNLAAAVGWAQDRLSNYSPQILISPYATNYFSNRQFDSHLNKIKITQSDGSQTLEFNYNASKINSGLNLAAGDLTGNGDSEIVAAVGGASLPEVSIFDSAGNLKKKFLAYDKNFRGGVSLAVGDVNGDGRAEIITAPAFSGFPQVKIFDESGKLLGQFLAYNKSFIKGVNLASADVNSDGRAEIITAPAIGGGPQVRVFNAAGNLQSQFMAYDKNFKGGVKVAAANLDKPARLGKAEIVVAPQSQFDPLVKVYSPAGQLQKQFLAYDKKFQAGLSVAAGDINNDGYAEIITGVAAGGAPHVRTFQGDGTLLDSFYAYEESFSKGVNVGFILITN